MQEEQAAPNNIKDLESFTIDEKNMRYETAEKNLFDLDKEKPVEIIDKIPSSLDDLMNKEVLVKYNLNGFHHLDEEKELVDDDLKYENKVDEKKLDDLLNEFRSLNCPKQKNTLNSYCSDFKENKMLEIIGKVDFTPNMFYNYLNEEIYKPLGYKMTRQFTFPEVFSKIMLTSNQFSMIHKQTLIPNKIQFKKFIMNKFKQIEGNTVNFAKNKDKISAIILDLLKRFHIYWNVYR